MSRVSNKFSFFPQQNIAVQDDNKTDSPLRVLQITDCHLGEQVGEQLVGMDTDQSLDFVIALLRKEQLSIVENKPALLLATGDLSNHGTAAAYQRLQQKLAPLELPSAWLPGNHDNYELMVNTVGKAQLPRLIKLGNWYIFMLDSAVPCEVGGELGADQLSALAEAFKQLPSDAHFLLCMHHQPIAIGSDWLDQQMIADNNELLELLSKETRVRALIWGHIHQEFIASHPQLPNALLFGTPSTCVQFAPVNAEFKVDQQMPGYRWLDLYPDGKITTGISRVSGVDLSLDLNLSGY